MTRASATIPLSEVVWDAKVYPRSKWSTATVERYAEAMEAGDEFPPLVLEEHTNRLLDGKHRELAYRKAGITKVPVEWHTIPEGRSAKHYAAALSARHGDRMSNADLKALAIEECETDPKAFDIQQFIKDMGIGQSTLYDWVGDILTREREARQAKVLRLSLLGWTNEGIGTLLDVTEGTVRADRKNSESGITTIRELANQRVPRAEIARRFNLPITLVQAILLDGREDNERLDALDIKIQPYDVWNFSGCHDLMGDKHPGRIPGELICHVLYFFTKPGDLVVDPMAGSGTALDACLLMGRKARGYDIDLHHERVDVEPHDLTTGWPETVKKAALIFWDPPYFDKKDDGYVDGSISGLTPSDYLCFMEQCFVELRQVVKPGARLAFLMSDWDPEQAKRHADDDGIFLWDYADSLRRAGWRLTRQIQVPLSTQQVHPDIVTKFRESRRLARLERYLLIADSRD